MWKNKETISEGELQNDNNQKMADQYAKYSGQHRAACTDIKVYGKGDNCICCKDPQSVYWFNDDSNTGFCMMCRQSFILVDKPEKLKPVPIIRKQFGWGDE